MKRSEVYYEIAERLDLHPRTVEVVLKEQARLFLDWLLDNEPTDYLFPLGDIGVIIKNRDDIAFYPSKEAQKILIKIKTGGIKNGKINKNGKNG